MTMGAMSSLCFFIAGLGRAAGGPAADAGADKPVVYLDTGLSAGDRDHFFRDGLGNRTLPESWFRALEDPSGRTLLGDRQNLASVGFLYEPGKDLPIGLARNDGPGGPWLGVNCAHCHTTDLSYKGQTVRIVGGTSRFDTNQFYGKLFGAILRTSSDEAAFKSFADRLLGPAADAGARAQLKAAIGQTAAKVRPFVDSYAALHPVASGPRFAFYDIFLNVTAAPLDPRNARPERAYAGMRSLWGMSKLQWAHADGAFSSTVARIAFGFSAFDAFYSAASVDSVNWNVANVHRNAVKIANKVQPPAWPERSFGRLDRQRVRRGERIYRARCAGCHEPGPSEDSERFLAASMIPYKEIGTDPVYIESQYDKHPTTGQLTPRKVFTGALAATVFADREGRPRPVVDFATDYLPTDQPGRHGCPLPQGGDRPRRGARLHRRRPAQRQPPPRVLHRQAPAGHLGHRPLSAQRLRPQPVRDVAARQPALEALPHRRRLLARTGRLPPRRPGGLRDGHHHRRQRQPGPRGRAVRDACSRSRPGWI